MEIGEAQTMKFGKQLRSIPVPTATNDGPDVIVIDYTESRQLQEGWS